MKHRRHNPQDTGGGFAESHKKKKLQMKGYDNMKEIITKDEYGSTIILKFCDTPNKKVEDDVMEMLIRTYENRLDVSSKLDGGGEEVI